MYSIDIKYYKKFSINNVNIANSDDYVAKIGFFDIKDNIITIYGLAHDKTGKMSKYDSAFIIKNNDNGNYYKLNTVKDFADEYKDTDIYECGMYAKAHLKFIPKGNYDLFIYYNNNNQNTLIKTNINFEME